MTFYKGYKYFEPQLTCGVVESGKISSIYHRGCLTHTINSHNNSQDEVAAVKYQQS